MEKNKRGKLIAHNSGALAQLVERNNGIVEVNGSIPLRSKVFIPPQRKAMPFFESLDQLPDDPLMSLPIAFAADSRPNKVNLGIGTYKDAEGKPLVLTSVKKAEGILFSQNLNKEYLPIEGHKEFLHGSLQLIFGENCSPLKEGLIFATQTLGGTSALRIGGEFLAQTISKTIFLPQPSWPNHTVIFTRGGLNIRRYRYYDEKNHSIDFKGLCQDIETMPPGSTIVLHACCHNPTGTDLTFEQWQELLPLIQKQKVLPFFDFAYQGFGETVDKDAKAIRYFAEQGQEMFVAYSYSKNMGLYGERVGALFIVAKDKKSVQLVSSNCKQMIRGSYSNPPLHGARLASLVLQTPELKSEWIAELKNMKNRLDDMREAFTAGLLAKGNGFDWSFIRQQKGIFSLLGLTQDQSHRLTQEYAIHLPNNGRINIAGLNQKNLDYVIDAVLSVMSK